MAIMIEYPHVHGIWIMRRNIMRFIHNYTFKWLVADFLFVFDIVANGVWGAEYYEFFALFGIQASAINAAVSTLQTIRICILLYQRAVERQAKDGNSVPFKPE